MAFFLDIFHVWTPREITRNTQLLKALLKRSPFTLVETTEGHQVDKWGSTSSMTRYRVEKDLSGKTKKEVEAIEDRFGSLTWTIKARITLIE